MQRWRHYWGSLSRLWCGASTVSATLTVLWGSPVWAQSLPAPIEMEGYERFWVSQTPRQRLAQTRGESVTPATTASLPSPPTAPLRTGLPAAALLQSESAWMQSQDALEVVAPLIMAQQGGPADPAPALTAPDRPARTVWEQFPLLDFPPALVTQTISTSSVTDTERLSRFPLLTPDDQNPLDPGYDPALLALFPLLLPDVNNGESTLATTDPAERGLVSDPGLLELFPLFNEPISPAQGSRIRQELTAGVSTNIPIDPNQVNIKGDELTFNNEQQLGLAIGNASVQFSDGTIITGERLLYYRRDQRIKSDGPFILRQPISRGSSQQREVFGRDLDLDIVTRSAQFQSSLVVVPGEAAGTKVFVRSEEATALIDNKIFFENATVTTSPELPITHYVKGDRVEIYPDDQIIVHTARVFAGGEQDAVTGDLSGGTQLAFFPLFIYSLRDHQWILPGYSEPEGIYVKSSWAYRFDQFNFGGLRLDAIQKKGIGIGFVHDYILPIADSSNYGRAQLYVVTEADQNRLSSRFRVDHFYDFYNVRLFGIDGTFRGSLVLNFDNVYRSTGGRNDNADFQLSSTFNAPFSTTTLNVSRTASASLGTYRFPITLNHSQRFADAPWLLANARLDYANQLNTAGGQDLSTARLETSLQARPPGGLGSFNLTYRTFSSSNGDTDSSRRNLEFTYTPDSWRLSSAISFNTTVSYSQNQQRDPLTGGQNFFDRYDFRNSLRFTDIPLAAWITLVPGSLDYAQVLYSTGNQESTVSLNPRLSMKPTNWSSLDLRFSRIFNGNNSTPFQSVPVLTRDTHRFNANLSFFTPLGTTVNVPPGYLAFDDDLPGEAPIALTFEDDTPTDMAEIASRRETLAKEDIRTLWRVDTTTGFDWITNRWDLVTANLSWNTTPNLYTMQVSTSYDPNTGQLNPINLRYSGRSSTTFERDLRSGLPKYEPGISYGIQASYDPKVGRLSPYSLDVDATIGTSWENHWRFRLGLADDGIRLIEIRRDLRDFEMRLAYDVKAQLLKLEGILVAFPSQPVGLTQQRGDFLLNTPVGTVGGDTLLP